MTPLPATVDLSSASCAARAYAHGAHLAEWTPAGQSDVLWLSPLAVLDSSAAIRGGVPVVFPWFGSGASGAMTPSHGFGRLTPWRQGAVERDDDGVSATFELDSTMATSAQFPHAYSATYVIRAGERLHLELSVTNTGASAFTFEEVLHTYLAVGDVASVTVEGLEGAEFADKVTGPVSPPPVQAGAVAFGTEVDRVYRSRGVVRVVDPVLRRVLVVEKSGSGSTVVWNPGAAKGAAAADIGAGHWREFVCVEGGNVQQDAVTLEPGESSTMAYGLHVEPLRVDAEAG